MADNTGSAADKLYSMIGKVKIAMLTTVESDGKLHTRPMRNKEADENGDLWFFLDKNSAAAQSIRANPRLSLGFSDPAKDNYAVIDGRGEVIHDKALIDEKWTDDLKAWFPDGKDDPSVALLRVKPEQGEFWDTKSSTFAHAVGYLKATFGSGDGSDLVDNRKVAL
jgi:general stress protein 26